MGEAQGIPFKAVRQAELQQLGKAQDHDLMALALSGGGIRSASFNLGVLQALARLGLLKQFEYLSTVSGGGYIGSWLSAWTARCPGGIADVEKALSAEREPREVRFLREFSNYLTPRIGWLSADTLTGVATYLRNMLLNLTIIVAVTALIVLVPWMLTRAGATLPALLLLGISVAALIWGVTAVTRNVVWQEVEEHRAEQKEPPGPLPGTMSPKDVNLHVVLPLVLWAASLSIAVWKNPTMLKGAMFAIVVIGAVAALIVARMLQRLRLTAHYPAIGRFDPLRRGAAIALGTLIGVALLAALTQLVRADGIHHAVVFGAPALLAVFLLSITFMLGIGGRIESEYAREWWSRLGGLLMRVMLAWLIFTGTAVYAPLLVAKLGEWVSGLGAAWILTTLGSVLAARSPASGKEDSSRWLELAAKIGPYVFMLGLLLAVSALLYYVAQELFAGGLSSWLWMLAAAGVLAAAVVVLSLTVDINLFSFHMFYRNRLVRCFLGASNPDRKELPFIGFDPRDNPKLTELAMRPYHLVNTALNLTSSKRLGWQERKAGSFVLSRLYCGYQFPLGPGATESEPCYQPTAEFVNGQGYLNLGTALTISGAAASPNMGYHSSPSVAFLLTVFNVRLGWWIQNPSKAQYWREKGPNFMLKYLVWELFGFTNELTPFVYVSDGGHFDNLGLYELVRRRCRFIVVSDASADGKFEFEDLGNAIRKCQIDFDCAIDIGQRAVVPDPATGRSRFHCAVGTIRYKAEDGDPAPPAPGYLLYIKSSLTGDEPSDVLQYAAAARGFPHESTQDQWFSESQFESYRKLGFHAAYSALRDAGIAADTDRESMFVALSERWVPAASAGGAAFARHGADLKRLEDVLRADPNLRFLDVQIYPEWNTLVQGAEPPHEGTLWLPAGYDELRAGFHFCSSMLQLMENVYVELNLEEDHNHPDNRGWMNLFRHWSWSGMFKVTYSVCCAMYGARFQRFCERRLSLTPGDLEVASHKKLVDAEKQLNFFELAIIERFEKAQIAFDGVHLLQMRVRSPTRIEDGKPDSTRPFVYTFGFALTRGESIVYFRVQDHLRRMSHARRALSRLYHRMKFRDWERGELEAMKHILAPLEAPDFAAFDRLFRSVGQLERDFGEIREEMLEHDRAEPDLCARK